MKLYMFNNFEIVHVSSCSGLNMVTLALIKVGLNGQTGVFSSVFQCTFISFICQLLNFGIFANLDQAEWSSSLM